jgi:hypothetical protein
MDIRTVICDIYVKYEYHFLISIFICIIFFTISSSLLLSTFIIRFQQIGNEFILNAFKNNFD